MNAPGFARTGGRVWLLGWLLLNGLCPRAQAQPSSLPRSDFWVTDGPVYAVVETNGAVYLGGDFSSIAPNQSRTALLDASTGFAETAFPFVEGIVLTAVPDGQGGWYLGGTFSAVAGEARLNLARLRPDLTVDPNWNPGANDSVHALAVEGNLVYAGGQFTIIGGRQRNNLAAIDVVSGSATDWNPDVCCDFSPQDRSRVTALAVRDGHIYAGGSFRFAGGQPRNNLVLLDPSSNEALPWPENTPNPDTFVSSLFLDGELLYVGGRFQSMGDAFRANLAAVNALSGAATSWNPAADGDVQAIVVSGDTVFAGGSFNAIGGQTRSRLAALDIATGLARAWNPATDGTVLRLATSGSVVYVGGDFTAVGGMPRLGLAALNATSGQATPWNPGVTGLPIQCLAVNRSQVMASGQTVRGARPRNGLAALDARTGRVLDWNPNADEAVFALAFVDGIIYAGGDFTVVNGQPRARVAAIGAIDGSLLPWGTVTNGPNGRVEALAVTPTTVYAAGGFSAVGPMFSPGMAAFNRVTGGGVLWRPIANRPVNAVLVSEGAVYAAGSFSAIGMQTRNCFAALDAATAGASGWNPNALGASAVGSTMARSGNVIYAGGSFTDIGGQSRLHLAALDVTTGQATDWSPGLSSLSDSVQRVSVAGNAVYVAGEYSFIGGQPRQHLAALDVTTAEALEWNPDPLSRSGGPAVAVVEATERAVYIGGNFAALAGRPHPNFAAFPPAGSPQITRQPASTLALAGQPAALSVEVSGQPPLAIQWQLNGTNLPGATSANLSFANPQAANAGDYSVFITNRLGYVLSASATLAVLAPLVITTQPVDRTVASGNNVNFTVVATGRPPPMYQWKLNGAPIPGATSATLSLTNVQPAASGCYSVVVFNGFETLDSAAAVLLVGAPAATFVDNFFSSQSTNSASGTVAGSNTFATAETGLGEPDHAGKPGGRSVWMAWIAPASGIATIDTRGSSFDTLLAAYKFSTFGGLELVAADDDSGGFQTSLISFNAQAGTRYEIAIDGYFGRTGRIVLNWNLGVTSDRLPRILLQPVSQTVSSGSNPTFTVVADGSTPLAYQWLRNGVPIAGATNLFLPLANVLPSQVGFYSVMVSNTTRAVESARAVLEIGPSPGVRSQDKLEDLLLASPTGANVATIALGTEGGQIFDSFRSTLQLNEPRSCNAPGGSSRWMRLRALSAGTLVLDTTGSSFDTVLAVYTGTNVASLAPVNCDNDGAPDGTRSEVRFAAVPGTDYFVAVDGVEGTQGRIHLNWRFGVAPFFPASPVNHLLHQGESITLGLTPVAAIPAPTYQWQFNGQPIPGATGTTLVLNNLQAGQSGDYSVVVRNSLGAVTNTIALVIVAVPFRLNCELVSATGQPAIRIQGSVTNALVLEATADLSAWIPLRTIPSIIALDFVDPVFGVSPQRFYRGLITPATGLRYNWITNDGRRVFRLRGPVSHSLIVEATTDLATWRPLQTNTVVVPLDFIDFNSTNFPARFYRMVPCQ